MVIFQLNFLQKHALLNRVESATSEEDRVELKKVSSRQHIAATLLPIRSVGVQVSVLADVMHQQYDIIFLHILV